MWILLIPLIVAEILFWAILAWFAWRAIKALRIGNWMGASVWASLLLVPFAFYFYKHFEADRKEAARATEIAALSRAPPPQSRPDLLEVHGNLTEFELLIMLGALNFDEVAVLQRPHRGEVHGRFVRLAPGCRKRGVDHLETWNRRGRFGAPSKEDKACLIGEWKTVSDDRGALDAVEYRHGTQATLLPPGNNWSGGAYEVRLRTDAGSRLVAYWERPYITRPSWLGPWGYAYPGNSDAKKYRQPKRLDFILAALAGEL